MKKVLYYKSMSNKKPARTLAALARARVKVINVSDDQINEKVGDLFALENAEELKEFQGAQHLDGEEENVEIPSEIKDDVLVLHGFAPGEMDALFKELRKSNAAPTIKAVLTKTNFDWPFIRLYANIHAEREYLAQKVKEEKENS